MSAWAIARFEALRRVRFISTWVYFAIFFAAAAIFTIAAGGGFPNANVAFDSSKVMINSPYALSQTITVLGYLGVLVTAALMGRAVQQDFEHDTFTFFFTRPITPRQYLGGRFLGAFLVLAGIFSSISLGCLFGVHFPTVDQALVGPGRPVGYVYPYLVSLLPNVLSTGAIFFALGALGRRMMPVYVAAVVMLIGYLLAGQMGRDLDHRWAAALLDPWGTRALAYTVQYWPVADRNTRLVPLESYFLWNRVLWLSVAAAVLAFTFARFRFAQPGVSGRGRAKVVAEERPEARAAVPLPRVAPDPSPWAYARMLPRLCWLTFKETVKNVYFLVIALAGVLFMVASARTLGSEFGTNTYPVAYQVLEIASGSFSLFMLIIATFYAGELVWRERDARMDQIHDALPIPGWLPLVMKLVALLGTQVLLAGLVLLSSLTIQLIKGYYHFELGLQLHYVFTVFLPEFLLSAALAFAIQVLVNQKYVGHFLVVGYWLGLVVANVLGFEDKLYLFGSSTEVKYSDMNGYGPFLPPFHWFVLYWALASLALAIACHLLWVRGPDSGWSARWRGAKPRFTGPVRAGLGVAVAGFAAVGGFLFWQTHVVNEFRSANDEQQARARYEQRYKARAADPQPKITDVKVAVDLYPSERRAEMKGTYRLRNDTGAAIPSLMLNLPREVEVRSLGVDRPHALAHVAEDGVYTAALDTPMKPGEEATLAFDVTYGAKGFKHGAPVTAVAGNGSFINSLLLPHLGYLPEVELVTDKDRRKYGLAPGAEAGPRRPARAAAQLPLAGGGLRHLRGGGEHRA